MHQENIDTRVSYDTRTRDVTLLCSLLASYRIPAREMRYFKVKYNLQQANIYYIVWEIMMRGSEGCKGALDSLKCRSSCDRMLILQSRGV